MHNDRRPYNTASAITRIAAASAPTRMREPTHPFAAMSCQAWRRSRMRSGGPTRAISSISGVRHRRRRVALAGKKQVLGVGRRPFVAEAAGQFVVEIGGARAHAADIEGEPRAQCVAAASQIIAHADPHIGGIVEIGEIARPAGARPALLDRLDDRGGLFRRHEKRQHAGRRSRRRCAGPPATPRRCRS